MSIPVHRATVDSTDSLDPDDRTSRDEELDLANDSEHHGLSRIFLDANMYGQILNDDHQAIKSSEGLTMNDNRSTHSFADLVGRDLQGPNKVLSERIAKLSLNTWKPEEAPVLDGQAESGDSSDDASSADDLFSIITPPDGSTKSLTTESLKKKMTSPSVAEVPPADGSLEDAERETLSPELIVELLINEFGALADPNGEPERLLIEEDGAFIQDVAILGTVHLTNYRICFHASLLSTRPDLLPEQQIIKKGPVTLHRPRFRRKRRVWLELSHDMVTTFPSSKEADRIKPIKSILLSSIGRILPEDPEHPTFLRLEARNSKGKRMSFAEFDTEESARQWRRELQGALYLYRHRRNVSLGERTDEMADGVRISVPLVQIESVTAKPHQKVSTAVCMKLSTTDIPILDPSSSNVDILDDRASVPTDDPTLTDSNVLDLAIVQRQTEFWATENLPNLVAKAKERLKSSTANISARTIVDFGPLSFVERRVSPTSVQDEKELAIREALAFPVEEQIWYTRARLSGAIATFGYLVVSEQHVSFWSKSLACTDSKYRLHASIIKDVQPTRYLLHRGAALSIQLKGFRPMIFDVYNDTLRDDVIQRIRNILIIDDRPTLTSTPSYDSPAASINNFASVNTQAQSRSSSMNSTMTGILSPLSRTIDAAQRKQLSPEATACLPKAINIPSTVLHRVAPMHFVCLTIGSRGDVQPYIALGIRLLKEGHRVTIVTHEEYKEWIEGWGLKHRPAGGDPGALMKLSVEHKMFSPQFFKESLGHFREWLDNLLVDAWKHCQDADVLLESPSAMAGVHIAEALEIPYFRTFTMPWTRTTEFPHAFLSPPVESASFNVSSYILFDNVFWTATSGQINRWRRRFLHLDNTNMDHMAQTKVPFIYNFSQAVVPRPMDWGDSIVVSGYWFLDNPDLNWSPPESLLEWMARARAEQKPIVYIGFGSITVPDPPALTRQIVKAVLKSDVRAIISKGWSSRMVKGDQPEVELPSNCYSIDKIPHDWLFPKIDAAVHHGGAGTTGASLRAGIPTVIKPWFGDQFFWASRVQRLGAGLKLSSTRSAELAAALTKATSDAIMKERAASVGQRIASEDGVRNAINAIYTYMPRAVRHRRREVDD